jgi:HEAT repeats
MGRQTSAGSADQERTGASVGERELVAAVEGRSETLGSREALQELSRRRSPRRTSVLTEVVADSGRPGDLRAAAAVELGRDNKASHRDALLAALRARDHAVVRRSAEALGRIGDEDALAVLRSLRPRSAPVQRSVRFARTLISYRLGLDSDRLRPPAADELLEVQPQEAVPVSLLPLTAPSVEEVVPDLRQQLPAVTVSADGAHEITCGDQRFLLVFNAEVHRRRTLSWLSRRPAVAAVVFKWSAGLDRYYLHEYQLVDPGQGGEPLLFGVRTTGVVVHFGPVGLRTQEADVSVRTVNTPYAPPVDIEGTYHHGDRLIVARRALVQLGRQPSQRRPATPRKLDLGRR